MPIPIPAGATVIGGNAPPPPPQPPSPQPSPQVAPQVAPQQANTPPPSADSLLQQLRDTGATIPGEQEYSDTKGFIRSNIDDIRNLPQHLREMNPAAAMQRLQGAGTGVARSLASGVQQWTPESSGVNKRATQYLESSAPKTQAEAEAHQAGADVGGMAIQEALGWATKLLGRAATAGQVFKKAGEIDKFMTDNPAIASALREAGVSGAATAMQGGGFSDILNASSTGAIMGGAPHVVNAGSAKLQKAARELAPIESKIGPRTFYSVNPEAERTGVTSQAGEPKLIKSNIENYEGMRDKDVLANAAEGIASRVNAEEPAEPQLSTKAGRKAINRTQVSTSATPDEGVNNATDAQWARTRKGLDQVVNSSKYPPKIQAQAQKAMDLMDEQLQARTDWRDPAKRQQRTMTDLDPKKMVKGTATLGEMADQLQTAASDRVPDMQYQQREYDANGAPKLDKNGDEVWNHVDQKSISKSEFDAGVAEGDIRKYDRRDLNPADIKMGKKMQDYVEPLRDLHTELESIYDLTRDRATRIKNRTGVDAGREISRSIQQHVDNLEDLANKHPDQYGQIFGRKDGITDLIAGVRTLDTPQKLELYRNTMIDGIKRSLKRNTSLKNREGLGIPIYLGAKALGLKHGLAMAAVETAAEVAHHRFLRKIASEPGYAAKILGKNTSPVGGRLNLTPERMANLAVNSSVNEQRNEDREALPVEEQ